MSTERHRLLLLGASLAALGALASPALAEFEVQESTIDAGEIQLQYRGATHHGLAETDDPDDDLPLDQSQEFELQMSPTSHWLLAFTQGYTQPDGETFDINAIEFETQVEIVTLEGDGFGFAMQGGIEQPVGNGRGDPGDLHFGPIFEYGKGDFLLTNDILFFKEKWGPSEQQGLGLEYSLQAAYSVSDRLVLALEAFGEVDDLAATGPFGAQEHYVGPAFYYTWGNDDDFLIEAGEGDFPEKYDEFTVSFGVLFGLTEASSDVAAKVFVGYEFN
ncbi:hypothetical protein V6C03_01160 [Methyloligella sp. 2.7D]|uniref:hypothetical protein n=1 Tax=unclassified Methyloligella TaxID=2625955 RepID=UPI00157BD264|nr:hypothetical protein [Methyloligella sp. GL2]QKP76730.1 hypothetical protein HT051_04255 [Methyloligella sp. GL2]